MGRPWTLNGSLVEKPLRFLRISEDFEPSVLTTGWKADSEAPAPVAGAAAGATGGAPGSVAAGFDSNTGIAIKREHEDQGDRPQAPLDQVVEDVRAS